MKLLTVDLLAITPSLSMEDKCQKSNLIIQGSVLRIIDLSYADDKSNDLKLNQDYAGPNSVALVRVQKVVKGDKKYMGTVIFVPCGYNFDASPSELSNSIKYVLFLKEMGHNYYHPTGSYCMHRILKDRIGLSGFDWEGEFSSKSKNAKTSLLNQFIQNLEKILRKQKSSNVISQP